MKPSSKRSSKRSKSRSKSHSKEEEPLDILLISGHGELEDKKEEVPSNTVYLYDVHCGFPSTSVKMEQSFFKKKIPADASYLSSWIMNTTNDKLGTTPVLVRRPNEEYYDSEISFILDYRYINNVQEYEEIDECDRIVVQKSGIYSYNDIKSMDQVYDIKERTVLNAAYIDKRGKLQVLTYDYELKSHKGAFKKLAKKHPNAEPFYIITKDDIREIYEHSIYPTVEDLELLFDDDVDYMRYTDFRESISMYDKKVSECLESYKNRIIAVPSCRNNDDIDNPRMMQIKSDSLEEAANRLILNEDTKYFSSSPRSSRKSSRSKGSSSSFSSSKTRKKSSKH
jgi:hypothetical protein